MELKTTTAKNGTKYYYMKVKNAWKRIAKEKWNKIKHKSVPSKKAHAPKPSKKAQVTKPSKKAQAPRPKKSDQFTIYGSSRCPWCMKAKSLLSDNNIKHMYYDIDEIYDSCGVNMSQSLARVTKNQRTIPIVFYKGRHIGGYSDLEKMFVF